MRVRYKATTAPDWTKFSAQQPFLTRRSRLGALEADRQIEKIAKTGHMAVAGGDIRRMSDKRISVDRRIRHSMSRQSILALLLRRLVVGFVIGVYGDVRNGLLKTGGAIGALMAAGFFSLERFVLRRNAGGLVRPLPFLIYFALRLVLYLCVIVLAIGIVNRVAGIGGLAAIVAGDVLFALAVVVGANLLFSVNDLLGPGVLFAFAAGRYYNPRIEERALLFVDMRSSTAIAERLGELRYLDLLNRFVADVSLAVTEAGGDIHKYVGDGVIATWRLAPGANNSACVRAVFAALDRIASHGAAYEREFGSRLPRRSPLRPSCGRRTGVPQERDRAHRRHDEHGGSHTGGVPRHRQSGARLCDPARAPRRAASRDHAAKARGTPDPRQGPTARA